MGVTNDIDKGSVPLGDSPPAKLGCGVRSMVNGTMVNWELGST